MIWEIIKQFRKLAIVYRTDHDQIHDKKGYLKNDTFKFYALDFLKSGRE